jgi:hypothetical protein
MTANTSANSGKTTPAYVPYATLISALDTLKHHGIPRSGVIDKTVWDSQSGSIQGQLILAFKFLSLIDDQKKILPSLAPLVSGAPEDRKNILRKLVEEKYSSILALDLLTISQGQLDEAFRKFDISGSTLKCAIRFFVKACVELGIPIAKRFSDRTRTLGTRKKRPASVGRRHDETPPVINPLNGAAGWEEELLDKFPSFDPGWSEELKTKGFAGFERLMGAKPE